MNSKTFRAEWLVLSMVGMAALATFLTPSLAAALVYDRQRLAEGELWRLFTGHLVHFSTEHLRWNLLALGLVAIMLPAKPLRLAPAMGIAACAISSGLYAVEPELAYYGGLSGLITALITFALTNLAKLERHRRLLAITGLSLLALKLLWEATTAHSLFMDMPTSDIHPSLPAHAIGYVTGLVLGFLLKPLSSEAGKISAPLSAKQTA